MWVPRAPARASQYMTPASGKKPIFVSGIAISVDESTIRRSALTVRPRPPPMVMPLR